MIEACRELAHLGRAEEADKHLAEIGPVIVRLQLPYIHALYRSVQGIVSFVLGHFVEALKHYRAALSESVQKTDLSTNIDFRPVLASELENLIQAFASVSGLFQERIASEQALAFYADAAAFANQLGDPKVSCAAQTCLGSAFRSLGRYEDARTCLTMACRDLTSIPDSHRCMALLSMGYLLMKMGQDSEAIEWLRRGSQESDSIKNDAVRYQAWIIAGRLLFDAGDFDSGLRFLEKADDTVPDTMPRLQHQAADSLVHRLLMMGRISAVLRACVRAVAAAERMKDPNAIARAYLHFGAMLFQRDAQQAKSLVERAIKVAAQTEDTGLRAECDFLYAIIREWCEGDKALDYWKLVAETAEKAPRVEDRCVRLIICASRMAEQPAGRELAKKYLQLVATDPGCPSSEIVLSMLEGTRARLAMAEGQWKQASEAYSAQRAALLRHVSQVSFFEGVDFWIGAHSWCDGGVEASERLWKETADPKYLWDGVEFIDAAKCVSVRHATGGHLQKKATHDSAEVWRAGPPDWQALFGAHDEATVALPSIRVRGTADNTRVVGPTALLMDKLRGAATWLGMRLITSGAAGLAKPVELKFPDSSTDADILADGLDREDIGALLGDDTIVLVFFVRGNDLVVAPVRRSSSGLAEVSPTQSGYFAVPGVAGLLHLLIGEQQDILRSIQANFAATSAAMEGLLRKLGQTIELDRLLFFLEPDPARRRRLHLVVVPDGPLYSLPAHAAMTSAGEPLYEHFASVTYGLSLGVLHYQHQIERRQAKVVWPDGQLRGVLFANPNRELAQGLPFLPGVRQEVESVIAITGLERWMVHGETGHADHRASLASFRRRHGLGNVIWCAGHGGLMHPGAAISGADSMLDEPGFLLCDGCLTVSELMSHAYDFSGAHLVNFASCFLGKVYSPRLTSKEIIGFLAALTSRGARRTAGALWQVPDEAAVEFSRHWIQELSKQDLSKSSPGSHDFGIAFRSAIDAFRECDGRRYDHAFFWSPYLLYGLG